MPQQQLAPYGSWKSPVTSDLIVSKSVSLGSVSLDGQDVYWLEGRPYEQGRQVLVRYSEGQASDAVPQGFNVRTRVHEYGGGAYAVHDGVTYFSNFSDNLLYRVDPGSEPRPLTQNSKLRYADLEYDAPRNRLVCVREDHIIEDHEAVNSLVSVPLEPSREEQILVLGNDFYSNPRISPDGSRLLWLTWNHPNMPWDGTELWVAEVAHDGSLSNQQRVAGGPSESIYDPQWSPDGAIYFISDRTGWWNLYRLAGGEYEPLHEMEAEFGRPQWNFGSSTCSFESAARLVCTYMQRGATHLAALDTRTLRFEPIDTRFTEIVGPKAREGQVYFVGAGPTEAYSVVSLGLDTGDAQVLRRSDDFEIDPGYLSVPQAIEFPTEGGLTAHGIFYPPKNEDYRAPEGEKPPLLVLSHGGPTSAAATALNPMIQFWTSRGFAVLDVNYGGSTGYGREYRQRLNGQWGVVDVDDCVNGAKYLASRGLVDPNRIAIRGGSAGGYTTLLALTQRDIFRAGASYYGISDLTVFAHDTHKFESRYLDTLVGPWPESEETYKQRSALNYVGGLSCPVIFFQGLDDKVVPPNQAELMVDVLREKGLPVAYVAFEGEGHGFRQSANIKRSLENELYFYSRVFGFQPAEPLQEVLIENM